MNANNQDQLSSAASSASVQIDMDNRHALPHHHQRALQNASNSRRSPFNFGRIFGNWSISFHDSAPPARATPLHSAAVTNSIGVAASASHLLTTHHYVPPTQQLVTTTQTTTTTPIPAVQQHQNQFQHRHNGHFHSTHSHNSHGEVPISPRDLNFLPPSLSPPLAPQLASPQAEIPIHGGGEDPPSPHEADPVDENQRNVDSITDAMAQHPELRRFIVAILKTLPFLVIILLKLSYDHLHTLLKVAFLLGLFLHTNQHLKKEIAKKQKNVKKLLLHLGLAGFGLFMVWTDEPYVFDVIGMIFLRPMHSFGELVFYLLMADLSIKCITVAVKTVVTMLPERIVEFRGRGRIYLLIEAGSQLYRCFLPVQPWAAYLLNNYEGYEKIFGTALVVGYVFWKLSEVITAGKFFRESYIKFKQNSNFGRHPTDEELEAVGEQCPICHESFTRPIALECSHIFCDLCIGVWFDRETTCPLCRKKIADDPRYRDGSTSCFIQVA